MVMNGASGSTFSLNSPQFPLLQQPLRQAPPALSVPGLSNFGIPALPKDSVSLSSSPAFPAPLSNHSTDTLSIGQTASKLLPSFLPLPNPAAQLTSTRSAAPLNGLASFPSTTGLNTTASSATTMPGQPFATQLPGSPYASSSALPSAAAPEAKPGSGANPALPAGVNALSPAQQTGKQVGDIVTKLLEEVPALQEKIDHIDWEALSQEEIMPKLEKLRISVQPTFKHVPTFVDRKLARLFEDPQSQQLAKQFFAWLRKEPDPETLASLNRAKAKPHETDDYDELDGPSLRSHRYDDSDSGYEADDEISTKKQSLTGRIRNRVQDRYDSLKDRFSPSKSEGKSSSRSSKPSSRLIEDDFSDSDLEPPARHSRLSDSDMFSPGSHGRRPSRFVDDEY